MRLVAPAKINWTLEVLGRRPDGYHEISTVIQTIDLGDEVRLEPGEGLTIVGEGGYGPFQDDLALRAARLLALEAGRPADVTIGLIKRIPPGTGLGGGSSDAAAVLRGLDRLWGLGLGAADLAPLAAALGSDVPFFLYGGTALAQGRGENIVPLPDVPTVWLVIVVPPFTLPDKTKGMYQALKPGDFTDGLSSRALARRLQQGGRIDDRCLHNAFLRAAYQLFPALAGYRDALVAAGAQRVHLAGSGPALFALAEDKPGAEAMAGALREKGGQVFVARTISAAEALTVRE